MRNPTRRTAHYPPPTAKPSAVHCESELMFAGVSGDRLALASNAIQQRPIGITGPMPQVGAQEPKPVSSRQVGSRVVQLRQILDDPATAQSSQSASTPQVQYENRFARLVHSTKQMPEVEVLVVDPGVVHSTCQPSNLADQLLATRCGQRRFCRKCREFAARLE